MNNINIIGLKQACELVINTDYEFYFIADSTTVEKKINTYVSEPWLSSTIYKINDPFSISEKYLVFIVKDKFFYQEKIITSLEINNEFYSKEVYELIKETGIEEFIVRESDKEDFLDNYDVYYLGKSFNIEQNAYDYHFVECEELDNL